jgi:putative acetyltransferase
VISIRPEEPRDEDAVFDLNERAFGGPLEASLVDAVRGTSGSFALVAEDEGRVVGHALFTPVTIEGPDAAVRAAGLGPMAVLPERQRSGIGSRLAHAGLAACRDAGYEAVVVLGHPFFYPRLGFTRAEAYGLRYEVEVPAEAFMVIELRPGAFSGGGGVVSYHPKFSGA